MAVLPMCSERQNGELSMKIIILAAGKGERLMPLTRNTPKPLLDMGNGRTLLEEQIDRIKKSGVIDEIVLVVGYLAEQIEAKVKLHLREGLTLRITYNPFYDISNNLMSLWMAKHEMDTDFMITNGDNIFSADVFRDFVNDNRDGVFLSVSVKEKYDTDDMKVTIKNGIVTRVSKFIPEEETAGESPGLALVSGHRAREVFIRHLEMLVRDKTNMNSFWLEVFNCLHDRGIPVRPWEFDGQTKWQEIDFHLDIEKAKGLLRIRSL